MAAAAFAIRSTISRQKGYSPGQLIIGRDMILPIKHRVDWELVRQQNKTQINRDNTRENKHRVDYYYKVGDKVMLTRLVPAQDVHFFYTRSHLSELQNCALMFSTNFHIKKRTTQFSH